MTAEVKDDCGGEAKWCRAEERTMRPRGSRAAATLARGSRRGVLGRRRGPLRRQLRSASGRSRTE
jgi:hypothetical protein